MDLLFTPSVSSREEDFMATDMVKKSQETKNIFGLSNWRRNTKRNPWPILTRSWFPCPNDWKQSRWRSLSKTGCSCRWRSHWSSIREEYIFYKNKWWLHLNKSGNDTLPLRKRSDFKQALSTLNRLHQESGEVPFVATYSYKHKQWQSAQSSSSTWCNWQDSGCVCVSFHPKVITMLHAWVERSLWLPWTFHQFHFLSRLHLYLPALPPTLHLLWG